MFSFFRSKPKQEPAPVVNQRMGPEEIELIINTLIDQRSRIAQAISGGYDFADTLHNIFLDFGYPSKLDFANYWNMYRRFGVAKNVIELPADITWMRRPEIKSDNTQFIRELDRLFDFLSFWMRMHAIDKRQRVGRYAGMFMRVRDGKTPDQPITDRLNGIGSIMQIMPLYEGHLRVLSTDTNPMSDNYGMPTMYQYDSGNAGNRNDQLANSFSIHPDRIVIISEDADNGGIYGFSALEAPYNSLMDLRKVMGGGAEGFYKNSAQNIVFSLKDGATAKANAKLLERFNEKFDEFSHNRFRRALWTPGMDAKTLDSTMVQPKDFFFNALYDVAASSKIPATILIGQQTGRLASNEDGRSFLATINSRRENFGTEAINAMIDWFIIRGVLPMAKYEVEWDDLLALSQKEQLDNASTMSDINDRQFRSGGSIAFTGDEIREAAGYEPMDEVEPGSELEDGQTE